MGDPKTRSQLLEGLERDFALAGDDRSAGRTGPDRFGDRAIKVLNPERFAAAKVLERPVA
jgi:hypothetical protein